MHEIITVQESISVVQESLAERIRERTGRRIRQLRIERLDGRFVIRGTTASYYLKQLAQAAVLEVLGQVGLSQVRFEIHVA